MIISVDGCRTFLSLPLMISLMRLVLSYGQDGEDNKTSEIKIMIGYS